MGYSMFKSKNMQVNRNNKNKKQKKNKEVITTLVITWKLLNAHKDLITI